MNSVDFIDHLVNIFFDLVMPAIGLWIVWLLKAWIARIQPPK